jgi:uncharacterized phage protein gp47/JayE
MAEIKQVDGIRVIDYMARDYDSLLQSMLAQVPCKLPEWQDSGSEADFGRALLELFAHMGDILSYYQDRVANESFLGTARTRRSVIQHLRLIGYELATAAPASALLSVTVPGTTTSAVTIGKGDAFATRSEKTRPSVRFEYTREAPLAIDFGQIAADPATGRKTFAGIPVEEGRLIRDEVAGTSDGSPNQRFPLARQRPILRPPGVTQQTTRDLLVVTALDPNVVAWTRQDSLAFSRAGQLDYVVEVDEDDRATIVFGDGAFGAIPPAGWQVRATYRVGGGPAGNVPAGRVQTIASSPPLALLGAKVTNPDPATGGADRETIEHAVAHAPSVFRSMRRAVTAGDYEALAMSFQGVGKVRAVRAGWNTVTLYVAPEGGGSVSDVLEAGLIAFFEDKRMVSQVVEIADVDYVPILVTAEIGVEPYFVSADVEAAVRKVAADLLAFDRVGFGQTIYLSRIYEESQDVPGVRFVNVTEFRRPSPDPAQPLIEPSGMILLGPNEVPVVPADADHAGGMKVVPKGLGGG